MKRGCLAKFKVQGVVGAAEVGVVFAEHRHITSNGEPCHDAVADAAASSLGEECREFVRKQLQSKDPPSALAIKNGAPHSGCSDHVAAAC